MASIGFFSFSLLFSLRAPNPELLPSSGNLEPPIRKLRPEFEATPVPFPLVPLFREFGKSEIGEIPAEKVN
jgi:hypothetical protein